MIERNPKRLATDGLLTDLQWSEISSSLALSHRQFQIVKYMFLGLTEHDIAHELSLSRSTVHTHLERLYRKVGVTNRMELAIRISQEFIALSFTDDDRLIA